MKRLSNAALSDLPGTVQFPRYDRAAIETGVVHLGVGAFHRAHQAVVFDDALQAGDLRWGIVGASLRSPDVRDQLGPQDGLYTVLTRNGDQLFPRVIGALKEVIVAPEEPARLVRAMSQASVHIVTLTITEKGYMIDPSSGALRSDDPQVAHDIANPSAPKTALGFLTASLAARRAAGVPAFAVVSCDNLPHNGASTCEAVLALATLQDSGLAKWIEENVAFPSTMVDRIVPATTREDIARLSEMIGCDDLGMVKTEPFTQWVIEDCFRGPRPDFSALGAQLTADVAPWENAKLRLLNGSHSAIAYLGALAGHVTVADAIAAPGYLSYIGRLMDEAAATLSPPPDLDVNAYRAALLQRFANAALQHRTRQIAMDGSQKLPQRLLHTISHRIRDGLPFPALALAVAGWMRWQLGRDDDGNIFTVDDPLASATASLLEGAATAETIVSRLLTLRAVFADDLAGDPAFKKAVAGALSTLLEKGAAASVASFPHTESS